MSKHIFDEPACQLISGLDSLYITGKFTYYDVVLSGPAQIFDLLESYKAKARAGRQPQLMEVYGEPVLVMGYGSKFYAYILQTKHFLIQISPHRSESVPPLNVQVRSQALWTLGVQGSIARLEQMLFNLGLLGPYCFKPSRVDLAIDVESQENIIPHLFDFSKTRGRQKQVISDCEKPLYVRYGKGDIQVRIYDKHKEIVNNSQKLFFYDLWRKSPDDFSGSHSIYRIEFQVRRKGLKSFDINTLSDLYDNIHKIWGYLTQDWYKLVYPQINRNKDREIVTPFWQSIQTGWNGNLEIPAVRKQFALELEGKQLAQAMAGMVLAYATQRYDDYDSGVYGITMNTDLFINTCKDMLRKTGISDDELHDRFISKIC